MRNSVKDPGIRRSDTNDKILRDEMEDGSVFLISKYFAKKTSKEFLL